MSTEKITSSTVESPDPEKVSKVVNEVTGSDVKNVILINKGAVNHPFLVETREDKLFVRIFSRTSWPEPDKPKWVSDQLDYYNIPHAKQIFYDRSDRFFPCGIEISEYIEGRDASEVPLEELTYDDFCRKVVTNLHKVHDVKAKGYGFVNNGDGTTDDLNGFLFTMIDRKIGNLKSYIDDAEVLCIRCKERLKAGLEPYQSRFEPTLVHNDVHAENCRYTKEGEVILIDWDNAMLYPWQMDMATALYWSWDPKIMKKAFLEEYRDRGFKEKELDEIINVFNIVHSINLCNFFLVEKKDREGYEKILERLEGNLSS